MQEWTPDPVVPHFTPDPELVARAQRANMAEEKEHWSPPQRYVRQQWEAALGATRVALDALRAIWPVEALSVPEGTEGDFSQALMDAESLYAVLAKMPDHFYTPAMMKVMLGFIIDHDALDREDVPR